jgi:cellulose synthase operon protein C
MGCWIRRVPGSRVFSFSAALLGWCSSLACQSQRHDEATVASPPSPKPALNFEFAGCDQVVSPLRCELGSAHTLTLWVPSGTQPEVSMKGQPLAAHAVQPVDNGTRAKYNVPPLEGNTDLLIESDGRTGTLSLGPHAPNVALQEAQRLRTAGRWQQARELVLQQMPRLDRAQAARARALLARLMLAEGHARAAVEELTETAQQASRDGLLSEAAFDTLAAAFTTSTQLNQFDAADELLNRATREFAAIPEVQALVPYYRAVLSKQTGQLQSALLHLRQAALRAQRLDLRLDVRVAHKEIADILHTLGRRQEALVTQRQVAEESGADAPCARSGALISLSWFQLNTDDVPQAAIADTLTQTSRALVQCPDAAKHRNHQLNLTYNALRLKDWPQAGAYLTRLAASAAGQDNQLAVWELLFRGELRFGLTQHAAALDNFVRAQSLADSSGQRVLAHAARLGRARVLAQAGNLELAATVFEDAETLARELVHLVPLGEGQQLFALQMEGGTRGLVGVLLKQRKTDAALAAARRGRLRLLAASWRAGRIEALQGERKQQWNFAVAQYREQKAGLDRLALDDWKLSKAELGAAIDSRQLIHQSLKNSLGRAQLALELEPGTGAPAHGEPSYSRPTLTITRDSHQWHAFVTLGERSSIFPLGALASDAPLEAWEKALEPALRAVVESALPCSKSCTLGVVVHPVLEGLDIHRAAFNGAPLLTHLPVVYLLDDMGQTNERSVLGSLQRVVIVGDPTNDLPIARQEAKLVATQMAASDTTVLLGRDATRLNLYPLLGSADLFHFSGHAHFGGVDGLESYLALADNGQLSLADTFIAKDVPRFAVLSACDAGRTRNEQQAGFSISRAFVAAGSEVAIAPNRSVPDVLAARFVATLYPSLNALSLDAWARATQVASLALLNADPASDWSSYRVHVLN